MWPGDTQGPCGGFEGAYMCKLNTYILYLYRLFFNSSEMSIGFISVQYKDASYQPCIYVCVNVALVYLHELLSGQFKSFS